MYQQKWLGYFQRKKELDINNEYSLKLLQEEKLQSRLYPKKKQDFGRYIFIEEKRC